MTGSYTRVPLLKAVTPLVEHPGVARRLGPGVRFFIKRDDIGEIGGGGNKLRKLEFALGAASDRNADTLVTFGAMQSNHARLTAAVAARHGMQCELILSKRVARTDFAYECSGNVLLMRLFGAHLHMLAADADPLAYAECLRTELAHQGRRPYVIPFGGSDPLGAMGYANCAAEIADQLHALGLAPDHVVVASGSGGTQAGLIVGFHAAGCATEVLGISVLHAHARLREIVGNLVVQTCEAMRLRPFDVAGVLTDDRFVGAGYGLPTAGGLDAIRAVALGEGVLLDPVYTGKAFAGLLAAGAEGRFRPGQTVVFVHTGGMPGLFAYAGEFEGQAQQARSQEVS